MMLKLFAIWSQCEGMPKYENMSSLPRAALSVNLFIARPTKTETKRCSHRRNEDNNDNSGQ